MARCPIDRRSFLRLCALAAGSALASACHLAPTELPEKEPTLVTPRASTPAPPTQTPPPPAVEIRLAGGEAEIWAWKKRVEIRLSNAAGCRQVVVNANGLPVEAALSASESEAEGGLFSAEVPIEAGVNRVVAECRQPDGRVALSQPLVYTGRLSRRPVAVIQAGLEAGGIALDGGQSRPAEAGGAPIVDRLWSPRPGNPAELRLAAAGAAGEQPFTGEISARSIALLPPAVDGEYYLRLRVKDESGQEDRAETYFVVENGQPRLPDLARENTAWVENAVVYGVIPRKFGRPAFRAIAGRLDDLADLGITALWLAPVNLSPPQDYGYAVVDYFDLNPACGSREDFHRLMQEAHRRGIRVLMDFVPNHTSAQHPYYQDAQRDGRDCHYWDFYDRDEAGQATHYFEWTHLPNLNYDNPEVRRMMIEAFSYWVREFDVDGFRVDVAWGIRQRNPEFWPLWRRELKRIKPDLLLLAEASARDPYYFTEGFDAAYDWTDQLGRWAWELVWDSYKHRLLAYNLHDALTNRPSGFHPDALIFRFLNNNDTGERFITRYGEGMARLATILLLTLPGIPCIYTGDEVGAEFHPYQDPAPLSWIERYPGLRDFHKRLIALRRRLPSLHSRSWQPLEIEPIPQEVYGYLRHTQAFEQPLAVLLNFYDEEAEMRIRLPERFRAMAGQGKLIDLLTGEWLPAPDGELLRIPLDPLSARILANEDLRG